MIKKIIVKNSSMSQLAHHKYFESKITYYFLGIKIYEIIILDDE